MKVKSKLILFVLFIASLVLASCEKNNADMDIGKNVSSITFNLDGKDIKINKNDEVEDTLNVLNNVNFYPSHKSSERTAIIRRSFDENNVYKQSEDKLVTAKTSDESTETVIDYLGFDKKEKLYHYNYVIKKDEGDGLATYVDNKIDVNYFYNVIDSTSEYYKPNINYEQETLTICYSYDDGNGKKSNEKTINDNNLNDEKEIMKYINYYSCNYLDYNRNPVSDFNSVKDMSTNYYSFDIKLTDKYLILDCTLYFSQNALYEYYNKGNEEIIKESKTNNDKTHYIMYCDYNNLSDNRVLYFDYYEYYQCTNSSGSGTYTEYMVPAKYVGAKYSQSSKIEHSYIFKIKEFDEGQIKDFKESIK